MFDYSVMVDNKNMVTRKLAIAIEVGRTDKSMSEVADVTLFNDIDEDSCNTDYEHSFTVEM